MSESQAEDEANPAGIAGVGRGEGWEAEPRNVRVREECDMLTPWGHKRIGLLPIVSF